MSGMSNRWGVGMLANVMSHLKFSVSTFGIRDTGANCPVPSFQRGMAVGKRGKPPPRATVIKDKESKERRRQHARDAKARNATDMDRYVQQAYKVTYVLYVC
jgi:hypothetical protein